MNNVKLEFNFASMNSGKSLSLITKHYMLKERGFKVVAVKPQLDTRSEKIQTRLGVEIDCFNIGKYDKVSDVILKSNKSKPDYILCDESQFFTKDQIWDLAFLVDNWKINVVCYGLKLNWQGDFFEGSAELMKIADVLNPIENYCNVERGASAFFHIKHSNLDVKEDDVGFEEKYSSVSRKTWKEWYDTICQQK